MHSSSKTLRRNAPRQWQRDHELPGNVDWMRDQLRKHKSNIPIQFDSRQHYEPYTPRITSAWKESEGYNLNTDMPWCGFLQERDNKGKRNHYYSKENARALFFEIAPILFNYMERGYSFTTSVAMAMYHCFPYVNRKVRHEGLEVQYSGFVQVNESA